MPDLPISEDALYNRVAPSVAFIQTPIIDGGVHRVIYNGKPIDTDLDPDYTITGSGVLIEGGYVITSHSVVRPYGAVRVVFPDGSDFEDVPVLNSDPLSGLAVLGPVDVPVPHLTLADGEDAPLGSDLFLIVYPAENAWFPRPVMGRGTLQALWETSPTGITYFEADITIADGYVPDGRHINGKPTYTDTISGGALVSREGELIGISVPIPHRENSSLVASASDIMPIVELLIRGENPFGLGDRLPPSSCGERQFRFEKRDDWDRRLRYSPRYYRRFLVQEHVGAVVDIELSGEGSYLAYDMLDPHGRRALRQKGFSNASLDSGSTTLLSTGPHFLTVRYTPAYHRHEERVQEKFGKVELRSNVRLIPLHDPDDGRDIAVGETIAGYRDAPYDLDWFRIRLEEGETVVISGESVSPSMTSEYMSIKVDFPHARENQKVLLQVVTGGNGVREEDDHSSVVYRAPHSGEYFLDVSTHAGYYLSVKKAPAGVEPVFIPPSPKVEGEVEGPHGPMTVYKSALGGFSIQVPAGWYYGGDQQHNPFAEYYGAFGPDNGELQINYDNRFVAEATPVLDGLEMAAFFFLMRAAPNSDEDDLVSREVTETAQGIPSERFVFSLSGRTVALATYYIADDDAAISIAYSFPAEEYDKFPELVAYSFSTFQVN